MSLVFALPSEILLHIASFLSVPDLVLCMSSCYKMKLICRDYTLWRRFFVELKTKDCPQGRLCHSGVVFDDKMYVYGGHITQPSSEYFHDVKQDMYEYSFGTREWATVPGTIAPKRTEHSAVVWKDSMIIFGGYSGVGYENSVFSFNYATREWTLVDAKGEIPTARSAHTAVLYNDKMYVFGGWNGQSCMNDLFELDLTTNVWKSVKTDGPIPCSRCSHGTTVFSARGTDNLFIFGGYATERSGSPDKGYLNDLFELNLRTLTWKCSKQSGAVPSPRSRFRIVAHQNAIYLFGGWNSTTHFSNLFKLSLDTGFWTDIDSNFDRDGLGQFSLCVNRDFMYIFSGYSPKTGSLDNLFAYKLLNETQAQ